MSSAPESVSTMPSQMDPKMVAAELLSDINLPASMNILIKKAAGGVYSSDKVYAYLVGDQAINRLKESASISSRYIIGYHPDDLMVVGGMALAFYDTAISAIKKGRGMKPLKDYLKKSTSDIDMVWWPRIIDKEPYKEREIITINSPGITEHVMRMKDSLQMLFQEPQYVEFLLNLIKQKMPNIQSLRIQVKESREGIRAGANKIIIDFIIAYDDTMITLEMCDISIHDGGSSQITQGPRGSSILVPMEEDPVYCNPYNEIKTLRLSTDISAKVPAMWNLINQQILAFTNLLNKNMDKCLVNYNRLRYIQLLLTPRNVYTKALLDIFDTPYGNIDHLIQFIDTKLNEIIMNKCATNPNNICPVLQQSQQQRHADKMMAVQLQHMVAQQRYARAASQQQQKMQFSVSRQVDLPKISSPKAMAKPSSPNMASPEQVPISASPMPVRVSVSSQNIAVADTCTLPDIEYKMPRGMIKVKFDNHKDKKDMLEQSLLCKYYHILENIIHSSAHRTLKGTDTEQLKRIAKFMHSFRDDSTADTIEKIVDREKNLNPLKGLLESLPPIKIPSPKTGGRHKKHATRRNQKRKVATRRH